MPKTARDQEEKATLSQASRPRDAKLMPCELRETTTPSTPGKSMLLWRANTTAEFLRLFARPFPDKPVVASDLKRWPELIKGKVSDSFQCTGTEADASDGEHQSDGDLL